MILVDADVLGHKNKVVDRNLIFVVFTKKALLRCLLM
jgi:hypothetical protein